MGGPGDWWRTVAVHVAHQGVAACDVDDVVSEVMARLTRHWDRCEAARSGVPGARAPWVLAVARNAARAWMGRERDRRDRLDGVARDRAAAGELEVPDHAEAGDTIDMPGVSVPVPMDVARRALSLAMGELRPSYRAALEASGGYAAIQGGNKVTRYRARCAVRPRLVAITRQLLAAEGVVL